MGPVHLRERIKKEADQPEGSPRGIKHFSDRCVILIGKVKNEDPGIVVVLVNRL